ncbi:MAG: hypothetical protein DRN29_00755 [Thermoplasmata archaeon]|nr:MAG: hypothetical protein DRN29_00755 [Thermoplasmata archaeon]
MRKIYPLLAVIGIIFLYFISIFSEPTEIELKDLWKYEGKEVVVEGIVKNKAGDVIEISDGNATGKIYCEGCDEIEYGDQIKARGKVGEYGEELIIYAEKVDILEKWKENAISLPYLAENYEKYVGMNVNVTGYIYSKYTGYFYLSDEYMDYKIRVYYNETIPFEKYERVCVKALFFYNPKNCNFYLKICQPFHGVECYDD